LRYNAEISGIIPQSAGEKELGAQYKRRGSIVMIKVLLLAANPLDSTRLRLDEEFRSIDQALQAVNYRDKFDLMAHGAVRISDLQGYLLRYQPHIVHFSSHGSITGEIILEDHMGNAQPVPSEALSGLFSVLSDNIRCVVLNACYSEKQAVAIAQHIDYVIGMSRSISDKAAIDFATAFYQAVGFGRDLKTAFDLGCIQIGLENLKEENIPKSIALHSHPNEIILACATDKVTETKQEEEAQSILSYQIIFDREAFQCPCIFETGLSELKHALDGTLAAMATGAVYSRDQNLLARILPKSSFHSEFFRSTLERVADHLSELRPIIIRLRESLAKLNRQYLKRDPEDPYMVMEFFIADLIRSGAPKDSVRQVLELMDEIDTKRNDAINEMNLIFSSINVRTLPVIPLSTERIISSSRPEMLNNWGKFYVRTHDVIRPLLVIEKKKRPRKAR
jgi:hypothetical protein